MENEVRLLREEWANSGTGTNWTVLGRKDRLIYELFLLLEKVVDTIGDHENQLNHVHRVPGGEDEDDEK